MSPWHFSVIALGAIALVGTYAAAASREGACGLTSSELEAVIQRAERGDLQPYPLRSIFKRASEPAGVVLSPFVRIAAVARRIASEGRRLRPEEIRDDVCAPTLVLRMRMEGPDPEFGLTSEHPYRLFVERRNGGGAARRLSPVWSRVELDAATRQRFLVAAFPRDSLQSGDRIVLQRSRRKPTGGAVVHRIVGVIEPGDLERWK